MPGTPEIIATGFGPFGKHRRNASWEALQMAEPALPEGVRLRRLLLDVDWERAPRRLLDAIAPDTRWVVAFGVADEGLVRIERFAINAADRDTPDVAGARFPSDHLIDDGPAAYESGLPCAALLRRLRDHGLPARESHHAGSYLCNCTFYHVMHHVAQHAPHVVAGFVHVPAEGRLALSATARAIAMVIQTVVSERET
jgi:pyroglutamyl-peptidase